MTKKRCFRWVAFGLATLLSGCALTPREVTPEPPVFHTDYDAGVAYVSDRPLKVAVPAIGPVLNPLSVRSDPQAAQVWDWYNPVLFSYSDDGREILPDPDYLEHITQDEKSVTYTLNPKARFNDGIPLAEGFKGVWEASKRPGFVGSDIYGQIKGITIDRAVVKVEFRESSKGWKSLFQRLVHPRAKVDSATLAEPQADLGAGPYRPVKIGSIAAEFEPNPNWWGRPALLPGVTLRVLSDVAAVDSYLTGELDVVDVTERKLAARIPSAELRRGSSIDHMVLQFRMDAGLMTEDTLRKAILWATVPEEFADFAFTGLGYKERVPGTLAAYEFQGESFHDVLGSVTGPRSVNEAGYHFEQGGWWRHADGIRYKGTVPLRLRVAVPGESPLADGYRELIALQLQHVGIVAQVSAFQRSDLQRILASDGWDLIIRPVAGEPDGAAYLCAWYCSTGRLNASQGVDVELRDGYANGAEKLALGQYGVEPLLNGPKMTAVRPGLVNMGSSGFATPPKSTIGWK